MIETMYNLRTNYTCDRYLNFIVVMRHDGGVRCSAPHADGSRMLHHNHLCISRHGFKHHSRWHHVNVSVVVAPAMLGEKGCVEGDTAEACMCQHW